MTNHGKYALDQKGQFVIEDYNRAKPFSNFFPGIAGLWGVPMWVFYVNRGQCITSFGIEGKDKSILEFQPANKAYRLTSLQGFRTFLKVKSGKKSVFWEPFQTHYDSTRLKSKQRMAVTAHDLTIEEVNYSLGLKVTVNYFTLPEEPLAALIRQVTVTNLSRRKMDIEMVDGLPTIIPYGLKDGLVKNISRTVEAWIKVRNIKQKAPYYQLEVEIADTPRVTHVKEGNFYFSFETGHPKLLPPIVEAACVFGTSSDFMKPEAFLEAKEFKAPARQQTSNRTPCAMSFTRFSLKRNQAKSLTSVTGFAYDAHQLNRFVKKITLKGAVPEKERKNKEIIDGVKGFALTQSSSQEFNLYCQQTFLDNVLRGGLPTSLKTAEGTVAFNVFSRKHGDLERDYNYFVLAPTFFSQGNGNYRDVNQNRRNDVWFNSDVKDSSIINFLSLIQADGYNPLVVKGMTFSIDDPQKIENLLDHYVKDGGKEQLREILSEGFQPGELLNFVVQNDVKLKIPVKDLLIKILGSGRKHEMSDHGEGFWTDHWTYNTDLLESFLAVYPERLRTLLLDNKLFSFYHNSHYVLPREQRYILTKNGVRQYHSVVNDPKTTKAEERGNKLRANNGEGNIYQTHLLCKLLCLIANKAASLDPSGVGIEMEADRPNWYDSLNGLPGLLGSSISETFELKRLCRFVLNTLERLDQKDDYKVFIFSELHTFINRLNHVLSVEKNPLDYWLQSNDVKEHYRYRIRQGIDGQENEVTLLEVKKFLNLVIDKTNQAVALSKNKQGLYSTYFYHEVSEYETLDKFYDEDCPYVRPLKFKKHALPLFLEGLVHALRVVDSPKEAKKLYAKVKKSPLYDKKLKMYKVNADLSGESEEIGRTRIFPAGWLENESVWLHMEYKYLLELLRCGLFEEFYQEFRHTLVPFIKPKQYGRSVLENSSFIVSSAHEDTSLHGQGFVARLSGSTAEFLHIWLLMNVGPRPFGLNGREEPILKFQPALPGWLFTKKSTTLNIVDFSGHAKKVKLPKNTYAFNFMGAVLTVYHNPRRRNTFGRNHCRIKKIILTYKRKSPVTVFSSTIPAPHAQEIRDRKIERIDVYFT